MTGYTIWDAAVEQVKSNEKLNKKNQDSVMLVIGSKNSGKSTICYKFVEKNDLPKPTLALEYSFARKSRNIDVEKDVCNIWELGGGTVFKDLMEIPITADSLLSLTVVLVLDLSMPEELWFTMQTLLSAVRNQIKTVLENSRDHELREQLQKQIKSRIQGESKNTPDPFPVPLLIVGSKYDLFQEIESEKRKLICKCLRYLAVINGATLQFLTNRNENLMNKIRVTLSHMIFGTAASKSHSVDYNKPLCVPYGIDSFQTIGMLPDPDNPSINMKIHSADAVAKCFLAFYPQIEEQNVIPEDPGSDPNFQEHDIDVLRAQKDQDLANFKKQMVQQKQQMKWD